MNLQGISVDIVRNEYEYNKYVSESYREQYSYEDSKASLPWIIVRFSKAAYADDNISKSSMKMLPAADFTNISAASNGEWTKDESDKSKLKLDLSKENFNVLMLEAKKDCGYASVPSKLQVVVTDNLGFEYAAAEDSVNLDDITAVLENIDKESIQQGGGYLAKVVYALVAKLADGGGSPSSI